MKKLLTLILTILSVSHLAAAATFYVAPSGGSDANVGSYASPFATIAKGVSMLDAGETLILKNGTYSQRIELYNKNGSSGSPITIRAETDFGVTLQGPIVATRPAHVWIGKSSWIVLQGIRVLDSSTYGIWLDGTTDSIIRKCVVRRAGPTGNYHGIGLASTVRTGNPAPPTSRNLVEDCIILQYHRHALDCDFGANQSIIRRVYANGLGTSINTQEGISAYGGSSNLFENCIVSSMGGHAFNNHGMPGGGKSNRLLGSIARAATVGFFINARTISGVGFVTNTVVENCAAFQNTEAGFRHWFGSMNKWTNNVAVGNITGFNVTQEDRFWTGVGVANWHPDLQAKDMTVYLQELVSVGNSKGFEFGYDAQGGGYQGVQTSLMRDCTSYGNAASISLYASAHVVATQSGTLTANPGYSTATYGLGAYLMPAPLQPTRGATILYRYENGALTTTPLWPWPTESQVQIETGGIGVTYEADGGLWKTLDGVYASEPVRPVVYVQANGPAAYESPITPQSFTFARSLTNGALTVRYTFVGDAVAGVNYVPLSDQVTLADGSATATAIVTPIFASLDAPATVGVSIKPDPAYTVSGGSATITIHPRARVGSAYRPNPGNRAFRSFP